MDARLPNHVVKYISPEPNSGCWLWDGAVTNKGYPVTSKLRAHRVVYTKLVGPIPNGLVLDHKCRVRCCCNPDHLEPITNRENILRGVGVAAVNAVKMVCDSGHSLSDAYVSKKGHRTCRACAVIERRGRRPQQRLYEAAWREANRDKTRAAQKRFRDKRKAERT